MRKILTVIAVGALVSLARPSDVNAASLSGNDTWYPCASGGARLGSTFYMYARRSNNAVWYKTTSGPSYSSWTQVGGVTYDFPAAATGKSGTTEYISLFARGTTNSLYVCKTTNGTNYNSWYNIGGEIDAAPSAAYFNGYMYAFVRGKNTHEIYWTRSADGYTNWSTYANIGGNLTSAPVAVTIGNTLYCFARGTTNLVYETHTTDGVNFSVWLPVHNFTIASPSDGRDPALASDPGYCIIFRDPTNWSGFHYPEIDATNASTMKFQMSYDNDWNGGYPTYYTCRAQEVDDAINLGAKVIIFRTADTKTDHNQVNWFMSNMRFVDRAQSIATYIQNHSGTQFWIEVGNEPDMANQDPWVARWNYIDTANYSKPAYASLTNCKWMASMPTKGGTASYPGWNYSAVMYTVNGEGSIQDKYDALGTHAYGWNDITIGDGNNPLGETYYALARLPLGKVVFVTEANINNEDTWGTKATKIKNAMYKLPGLVRGWEFFALTTDPGWNSGSYNYGIDRDYVTQQPVSGRPFASGIGSR